MHAPLHLTLLSALSFAIAVHANTLTLTLTSHVLNTSQIVAMQAHARQQANDDWEPSRMLRRQATISSDVTNRYNSYTADVGIGSGNNGRSHRAGFLF
jgi:hypothetical protein